MPNRAVVTFAPLVLEGDNLLVLPLFHDFSRHFCSRDERVAVCHIFAIGKHEHVTECRGLSRIHIEKIDINRIAFCDAKLSASSLDNCVTHKGSRGRKVVQNSIDRRHWQTESLFNEEYALHKGILEREF